MEDTSDIGCEGKLCAIASDTNVVVVSIFRAMVTYTLRGLELCISTLPALHVVGNLSEVADYMQGRKGLGVRGSTSMRLST